MHAHPAPRSRPRHPTFVSAASPPPLAGLFGRSSTRYPSYYRPDPASRSFVQHLRLWYAQSHPDEDFAETFAVWLTPRSNWRKRYAGWPALKKLQYVDELMAEIASAEAAAARGACGRAAAPAHTKRWRALSEETARTIRSTPAKVYDRDLLRIFSDDPRHRHSPPAAAFIRRNRGEIRQLVSKWTGEYQLTLDQFLDDMIGRCRELKLRAVGSERQLRTDFTVLLTAKTVHSLYSPHGGSGWHYEEASCAGATHPDLVPPDSIKGHSEQEIHAWKTCRATTRRRSSDLRGGRLQQCQ